MYLLSLSLTVGAARLTSANRVCLVAMLAAWLRLRSWLFRSGDWMTLTALAGKQSAVCFRFPALAETAGVSLGGGTQARKKGENKCARFAT